MTIWEIRDLVERANE